MFSSRHILRLTHLASLAGLWLITLCGADRALAAHETITKAADIRALSASEAAEARPVSLRAVVIAKSEPRDRALLVADQSAALYVLATNSLLADYNQGDLLAITGVTDPGQFAPILQALTAEKLGTAPLPAPQPASYHELITGALDAQYVEVSGVVQQIVQPSSGDPWRCVLSLHGGLVHVRMDGPLDPNLQEDAEVRMRALCFCQFNQKRQMLNPVLQVPPGVPIQIVKPAPRDPWTAPVRSVARLLLFSPRNSPGHRIHVRGVVVHCQPGSFVWVRDDTAGLRLQTRSTGFLKPGDLIDVLGFPKFGASTPNLEDAILWKLETALPPAPVPLAHPTNAFGHGDDLVSLEAKLTEVTPVAEGLSLSLESEGTVFKALLTPVAYRRNWPDWLPGSRVRVAGICSVIYDDTRPLMGIWHPAGFQLLLRSRADLTILQAPSWWTLQHLTYLLGIALGTTLLVTGGIMLLARRRLREQEHQRAMAEVEFAAILSERNRVAREIHDTLAQGLAATSVQLRLAKKQLQGANGALSHHLDAAQELVRGSLQEARNSIWNMRSQVLETDDLPGALNNILKQMAEGSELKTHFKVVGEVRRLAPVIENNLLRVGQEAITNAVRHAQASTVSLQLEFSDKQFCLSVRDDGRGFDVTSPPKHDGGFGLVGMRERARELQGELLIRSTPAAGTEIRLSIPLAGH